MGAIILSNYVARSGEQCSLDAAISVSGGLDMRHQLNFRRSMRLWQPMLTFGLRDDILIGKHILYSLICLCLHIICSDGSSQTLIEFFQVNMHVSIRIN
jgi:hypothetical protein